MITSLQVEGHSVEDVHPEGQGQMIVKTKIHHKYDTTFTPNSEVKYRIRRRKTGALYRSPGQLNRSSVHLNVSAREERVRDEEAVRESLSRSQSDGFIYRENPTPRGGKVIRTAGGNPGWKSGQSGKSRTHIRTVKGVI